MTKVVVVVAVVMVKKVGLCLCWVHEIGVSRAVGVVAKLVVCWLNTGSAKLKRG